VRVINDLHSNRNFTLCACDKEDLSEKELAKVFTVMEYLSFADLIQRNGPLKRTLETGNIPISGFGVLLTNPAVHTLAPEIKAAALEFTPHQGNDS
jgi:hypothetical protein